MSESHLAGTLDRHAVGHWIGERDADLNYVRACRNRLQMLAKPLAAGKAGREKGNQRGLAPCGGVPNGGADGFCGTHCAPVASSVVLKVGMSLSPRPERQTRIFAPGFFAANTLAPASA